MKSNHQLENAMAQVEIPQVLLEKLILSGLLPGGKCKCLNATAKKIVWQSLLNSINLEH